jgi:microcystin-dependent protein
MPTYKKVSDLDAASAFGATDQLLVSQSGVSKKLTGALLQQLLFPAGTILPFGASTAPDGFLACDGSAVSRATYADLFAVIGETWGVGDGSTTFNVPNLAGAFLRGTGTGTINARNKVGPSVGAFQEDQMQGHYHQFRVNATAGGAAGAGGYIEMGAGATNTTAPAIDTNVQNPRTDGTNGTPRTGDETRPYAAGVLYIIKF